MPPTLNMQKPPGYGFVSYGEDGSPTYLSLISVSAKVHIVDVFARVVLTQLYVNDRNNDRSMSAQYIFPVPASGAVCAFKMQASGGQVVQGVVKERSKALNEYDIAISNNQWAGLLYEATPDVFVISIGAIPRGEDVEITIDYVVELCDEDLPGYDKVEFSLPTYVATRYGAPPSELMAPSSSSKGSLFNITVEIQMTSEILSISSPSHAIRVFTRSRKNSKTLMYTSTVTLDPNAPASKLDIDFILAIHASELGQPRCIAEKRSADMTVAMSLTFVPRFRLVHLPKQEYVFLVDRSSSMSRRDRMVFAKEALLVFLKSLPNSGTLFNIFSFGASYSSLWQSSRQYVPATLENALTHVNSMRADMGPGTEIKFGLQNALESRNPSVPMSVFLLTDGQVWGLDDIFSLVNREVVKADHAAPLRIFTLGIGNAASTALCEGVARRGNGLCLMTTHSADISHKCARLLSASKVAPLGNIGDIEIDWGQVPATVNDTAKRMAYDDGNITSDYGPRTQKSPRLQIILPDPPKVQQAPTQVPDLYPANRFTVFAILSDTTDLPKKVTLHGKLPDGSHIPIPPIIVQEAADGERVFPPLIHTLAARRLIMELEDGDTSSQGSFDATDERLREAVIEGAVVRFSMKYQLASQFASFVAVDESKNHLLDGRSDSDTNHGSDNNLEDLVEISDDGTAEAKASDFEYNLDGLKDITDDDGLHSRAGDGESDGVKSQAHDDNSDDDDYDFFSIDPSTGSTSSATSSIHVGRSPVRQQMLRKESWSTDNAKENRVLDSEWELRPTKLSISEEVLTPPESALAKSQGVTWELLVESLDYPATGVLSAPALEEYIHVPFAPASKDSTKVAPRPVSLLIYEALKMPSAPVLKHHNDMLADLKHRIGKSSASFVNAIWAPASAASQRKKKPTATATGPAGASLVSAARLQHFDGSFNLDDKLCFLISQKLSPNQLKSAIPLRIRGKRDAEKIWATALAAAYMKVHLGDSKDVWIGLWQKAADYIQLMLGSGFSFASLVDEASELL